MIACGVDIESNERLLKVWHNNALPKDLFTQMELKSISQDPELLGRFFTAKEAVLKSLGVGWFNSPLHPWEIELRKKDRKGLAVSLYGYAEKRFSDAGFSASDLMQWTYRGHTISAVILKSHQKQKVAWSESMVSLRRVARELKGQRRACSQMDELLHAEKGAVKNYCMKRRISFISGRIAARESVRHILKDGTSAGTFLKREFRILNDTMGKPTIAFPDAFFPGNIPALSISHSKDFAVGMAAIATVPTSSGR